MKILICLLLASVGAFAAACSNTNLGNGVTCVQSCQGTNIQNPTPSSCSFGSLPTIGNLIIAVCNKQSVVQADHVCVSSDNQSNSYHLDAAGFDANNNGENIYSAPVSTSSGTFTVTGTATGIEHTAMVAFEISGLSASPFDKTSTAHQDGIGTSWTSNNTATTAQATELLFGFVGTANLSAETWTAGTSYTIYEHKDVTTGGSNCTFASEMRTVSATGTYPADGTANTTWTFITTVATYKIASATAPAVRHPVIRQ